MVATGDPFDVYALDELQTLTGLLVQPVLASPREIARLIKTHFGVGGETVTAMVRGTQPVKASSCSQEIEADDSEVAKMAQEASVVKLVNEILVEAANERASDIHIEPEENGLRIRYRIDGMLQTQTLPPEISRFQAAIISRIKIMARLNIAEKRLPQDGRIKMRVHNREIDVRVSIIPMMHGEGIVMRLLDKSRMVFNLANVGMLPDTYNLFRQMIDRPHGIVLVTGPTGSGKSTTLYSALNEIKDDTHQDHHRRGPGRVPATRASARFRCIRKIGLTFAAGLRSILRHDPDVILIGEIRDLETAESAIQASLTGPPGLQHLAHQRCAQRLHALDRHGHRAVPGGQHRRGRLAQRLVRDDLSRSARKNTGPRSTMYPRTSATDGEPLTLWRGVGCRACHQTGYRGRMGIFELMVTNEAIHELCVQRVNATSIRNQALKDGMLTLRQDGCARSWRGQPRLKRSPV